MMDVQGFRFNNAPWQWSLQPADQKVASLQQLFQKFLEDAEYDTKPLLVKQPDGTNGFLLRDPVDAEGRKFYGSGTNWIVAAYRRRFYITIERQYNEIFGPHPARLFYRSYQLDKEAVVWVATCQLSFMWHSDERALAALQEALAAKEFYQSEKSGETIVIL